VSHLGVVVIPTLLALSDQAPVSGRDFIAAAVCGYEVSAQIGRALMIPENVRQYRPTGICGPPGAALAGARMLGADEDVCVSALAFGANVAAGLNEWPYSGGDEMFFHVGIAARNAVLSAQLAQAGANCSETSLDGTAGLFRALRSQDRIGMVKPFDSGYEILSVFHKPAPACNYAQTAAQAALALSEDLKQRGVGADEIASIRVRSTAAAIAYPGCDHPGPFLKTLQAKMSIHYCVAATLFRGEIAEANYRMLDHPEIARLASLTRLEADADLTAAYPSRQGSEVILTLHDGSTLTRRLPDVIPATPEQIRARFLRAAEPVIGLNAARDLEAAIDDLELLSRVERMAELAALPVAAARK
jgi:2-methylcitrate dehydratase PrpD